MATKTLRLTVAPSDGLQGYWIAVGNENVALVGNKGSVNIETDRKHFLVWWFVGNPGNKLSIMGKVGDRTVVEVKASRIPQGEYEGAGAKRFSV